METFAFSGIREERAPRCVARGDGRERQMRQRKRGGQ